MKLSQVLAVVLSILFVFLVQATTLEAYTSQILALVILFSIIYIILKKRKGTYQPFSGSVAEVFSLVASILLVIVLTGSLASAVFFFVYFLLFGVAFLTEPRMAFVLTAGVTLLFIPEALAVNSFEDSIPLAGILLLSPVAYFFANEYQQRSNQSAKTEARTEQILEDADALLHTKNLDEEGVDELDDIIENANEIRQDAQKE